MLALRFALIASFGAVALWGLFSLLDNLKEPELLRSPRAVVVKGCDPAETDQARRVCPGLKCQKSLLDAKLAPLRSSFVMQHERVAGTDRLVIGSANPTTGVEQFFACTLNHEKVVTVRLIDRHDVDGLLKQDGGWELGPAR